MIKRYFYPAMDKCYDEYLVTKCPIYKDIYIGGLECHKCPNFFKIHEKYDDEDHTDYVICRR